MQVSSETVLPAPIERAWEVLMRWEDQAIWMKDADSVTVVSPHREGVGVVLAVKTRVLNVPLFTEKLCWTCVAARKLALPAWSALSVQVPTPMKRTTPDEMEQTAALAEAMLNVTARPEVAVAAGVYVGPPATLRPGGVEVMLITFAPLPTANDCCACGAAL